MIAQRELPTYFAASIIITKHSLMLGEVPSHLSVI